MRNSENYFHPLHCITLLCIYAKDVHGLWGFKTFVFSSFNDWIMNKLCQRITILSTTSILENFSFHWIRVLEDWEFMNMIWWIFLKAVWIRVILESKVRFTLARVCFYHKRMLNRNFALSVQNSSQIAWNNNCCSNWFHTSNVFGSYKLALMCRQAFFVTERRITPKDRFNF